MKCFKEELAEIDREAAAAGGEVVSLRLHLRRSKPWRRLD
jgi:hypothetical protein